MTKCLPSRLREPLRLPMQIERRRVARLCAQRATSSSQRKASIDVLEPSDSYEIAARVLDGLGVRWALAGALAALRYRRVPRMTTDADLLIATDEGVADAFRDAGYEVVESADVGERPHLLAVRGRGVKIDLMVVRTPYQELALDRAVGGVLTAEDVIIHKLIAWRARDRDDIDWILASKEPLDEVYIRSHAADWEVEENWDAALLRRD